RPERRTQGLSRTTGGGAAPVLSPRMAARFRRRVVTRRGRRLARSARCGGRVAMLRINVVTLFPDWFSASFAASILGRAAKAGLVQYRVLQLRDFTHDKHHTLDGAPDAGGPGTDQRVKPIV